uniref:DUF2177 family protein n=1 Tax=viral metagenome TaxID=1070528 RepID=A0A6C0KPP2_9ZZZZ
MWTTFVTFMILTLIIDSIWVVGANKIHSSVIQGVQKSPLKVSLLPAFLFYLLVPLGYLFIIKKLATDTKSAFLYGMLLGLLMYGTFDLTNKAVFEDYPWAYTIADMTWGTFVIGLVSAITYKIT